MTHRRVYLSAAPSGSTEDSLHDGSLSATGPSAAETLTVATGLNQVCSRDAAQGSAGMTAAFDAGAKAWPRRWCRG
ncbi:hypothetical protein AB0G00_36665 [Nocardia salmonicida]|uniref:hypothetical protein n=1 Tax=Nocardia salmonicida TaxID=53431 RepID=UPI0033F92E98